MEPQNNSNPPSAGMQNPAPVYENQNVVPPAAPPPSEPESKGLFAKLPLKSIAIGLLGLLVIVGIGFGVKQFFFNEKVSEMANITYWGLWEDQQSLQDLIAEYEAQNPNVKISYTKQAKEDYRERLVNAQKKGEGPDIFRFHNTWVPMLESELSALPENVMATKTFETTFYPVTLKDLQSGSQIVGMPLMFDGLGLYINEEIFTQAGRDNPTTWNDLRVLAKELTIKDSEGRILQAGVALGRIENVDHWEDILSLMMLQNRVNMSNPTDKLAQDALLFFTAFNTVDKVWDESLPPSVQAFAGGKLAMLFAPSWRVFEIKQQNPNLSFRVVPVPQLPKNSPSDPDITWASYWVEGVSNKSKNTEASWKFLKFLSEKSSQQKLYANSAKSRLFGPIYARTDMADLIKNDPFTGAFVLQAPSASSWYLASRTFDGPTGINSKISTYFKNAINAIVLERQDPERVLPTVAQGVIQVLGDYGRK